MVRRCQPRTRLDDRHRDAEARVDLRQLAARRAAAEDDQAPRQLPGQRRVPVRPGLRGVDPLEGRHLPRGTQDGIGHRDRPDAPEISAPTFKPCVGSAVHHNQQVSRPATRLLAWQPAAGNAQHHAFLYTNGDLDREFLLALHCSPAGTR